MTAVMPFAVFERALAKLIGAGVTSFVVALLLQRVVLPRVLALVTRGRWRARPIASEGAGPGPSV